MSGGGRLRLGIGPMLPTADPFGEGLIKAPGPAARHAEQLGFDAVWTGDHIQFHSEMVESSVVLAAAAGATRRIGIGFAVLLAALRPPALVAKQVAALQIVSGGRLTLGIGVGGENPAEWDAMGVPVNRRGRRTDDFLAALPGLLAGEAVTMPDGTPIPPLLPTAPAPPVWVGGRSEAALRRAARFGDAWLALFLDAKRVGSMREQLAELAAVEGRPAPGVALSIFVQVGEGPAAREEARQYLEGAYNVDFDRLERYCAVGSVAEVAEKLAGLVEAGVEGFVLMPAVRDTLAQYEPLAEAAALLRAGL